MDKKTVNYIKAIAEMRSISAAAESLGISQPALSAHLKKTETELGAILFDRSRQPLELTEAGQAYLNYLERTQSLEKELAQTISDIEGLETGSLTIGGAVFFNIAYIPRAVSAFVKEYPGVNIEIVDGNVPFLLPISITNLNSSAVLNNDGYGILSNQTGEGVNAIVAVIQKENY